LAIFLIIALSFNVIVLLRGIILLFYGQSKNPASMLTNIWVAAIANALFYGGIFALMFVTTVIYDLTGYAVGVGVSPYVFVALGGSVLFPVILTIYYLVAFRKGYYQAYVQFVDTPENDENGKYVKAVTIPETLTHLGGHCFANNQYIKEAKIPSGITEIGPGAFANCGQLNTVIIPRTIRSIKYNAFFNCPNLKRIIYLGTKENFSKIQRGSNWLERSGTNIVKCWDAVIKVATNK
jgi:hypothetical protein